MSFAGASGSTVGYETFKHRLILLIKTLLVCVVWMMFMLCLHNKMHDIILISAIIIFTMISLNKHIYDMLCKSYFWNKLNIILLIFVTIQKCYYRQFLSVGFVGLLKPLRRLRALTTRGGARKQFCG